MWESLLKLISWGYRCGTHSIAWQKIYSSQLLFFVNLSIFAEHDPSWNENVNIHAWIAFHNCYWSNNCRIFCSIQYAMQWMMILFVEPVFFIFNFEIGKVKQFFHNTIQYIHIYKHHKLRLFGNRVQRNGQIHRATYAYSKFHLYMLRMIWLIYFHVHPTATRSTFLGHWFFSFLKVNK